MTEHAERLGAAGWPLDVLDGLVAAGVVDERDLDGLKPRELAHVAAQAVRHAYAGFDVDAAKRSVPAERRNRPRAAA